MSELVHYQLCTYDRREGVVDPFRARYDARYRSGETSAPGDTWDERFAAVRRALEGMPEDGWRMTVGGFGLCEFYHPEPRPFGHRVVMRMKEASRRDE